MSILREVAAGLLKMFVGDAWLTIGILSVVSLTTLLTGSGAVDPLLAGALLFLGCIAVLIGSIGYYARHRSSPYASRRGLRL